MGYYTYHRLEIVNKQHENVPEVEFIKHMDAIGVLSGYEEETFGDCIKWYDHDDHMRQYSKEYPDLLFILSGEGEESGDIWKSYYQDGKMQVCQAEIVFPPYDPTKMR